MAAKHVADPWEHVLGHLTLANIGISIFDLQISTLGTTIRPQNLPFRPGVSQETFRFFRIDYRFLINDYDLPTISGGKFS